MRRYPTSSFPGSGKRACTAVITSISEATQARNQGVVACQSLLSTEKQSGSKTYILRHPDPSTVGDTELRALTTSQLSLFDDCPQYAGNSQSKHPCTAQPFVICSRGRTQPEWNRWYCKCPICYDGFRRLIVVNMLCFHLSTLHLFCQEKMTK